MQNQARLVIIGAGIVGCSVAYHLAQKGWREIVVLDQGPLFHTGGSTSHAPGLVFQTNASKMMTSFARYTVELLNQLEDDGPCFYPVGGIEVATTPERWQDLHRKLGWARAYGLEAHLISPKEVQRHIPLIDPELIHGGYYVPSDGDARAVAASAAMARIAEKVAGATFIGETRATGLEVENGRCRAVLTDKGRIETESVLLCTNIWAPVLARQVGVRLPIVAVEHQYAITTPLAELAGESREIAHPILRHQDHSMYFRQHAESYGIGSYQHEPLLVWPEDLGPTAMKDFTPKHFEKSWLSSVEILPPLKGAELQTKFNGMFAFTPDAMPILGPARQVAGLWVAAAVWVTHSGGVGRVIAEWMDEGEPGMDIHEADISRFHPYALTRAYTEARCTQQYREVYDIIHPLQQLEKPRGLRLSPFHAWLQSLGAHFFESAGWERPQWYERNAHLLDAFQDRIPDRQGWAARHWSPIEGAEHLATREHVALYDLTPFTKIEVSGPGALGYLNHLAANQIDQPVGKVVYTSLLTPEGKIKCDLTITRLEPDRFLVLTGGGSGPHDLAWFRIHQPPDGSVSVRDVSSSYCSLGLWGPNARKVLQQLSEQELSNQAFPYYTAQRLTLQTIPALALRVSYVGELGWELYCSPAYGPALWDLLWEAGRPHGILAAGLGAFDSLRLEKGYRLWGNELHTDYDPFEAGLGWAVRMNKGDFIGRQALERAQEAGMQRKLCCLTLDDPGAVALGKEPILDGDRPLGYVTSANFGYSTGYTITYGYLPLEQSAEGTRLQVEYLGQRQAARVVQEPLFDPKNERLKR